MSDVCIDLTCELSFSSLADTWRQDDLPTYPLVPLLGARQLSALLSLGVGKISYPRARHVSHYVPFVPRLVITWLIVDIWLGMPPLFLGLVPKSCQKLPHIPVLGKYFPRKCSAWLLTRDSEALGSSNRSTSLFHALWILTSFGSVLLCAFRGRKNPSIFYLL